MDQPLSWSSENSGVLLVYISRWIADPIQLFHLLDDVLLPSCLF